MHREGLIHDGIELAFGGSRHRIDFNGLTGGKSVMIYGQTEVTRDLMDALANDGVPPRYEAKAVSISGIDGRSPIVAYIEGGAEREIDAISSPAATAFMASAVRASRQS